MTDAGAFAGRLEYLERVDSTNAELRRRAAGLQAPAALWAGEQEAGRGRFGRNWYSPPGGLYLSALFRPRMPAALAGRWTIAAALAAADALVALDPRVRIRWPNDLLVDGCKVAGILVELRSSGEQVRDLIVGWGINLGPPRRPFPTDLRTPATSLIIPAENAGVIRENLIHSLLDSMARLASLVDGDGWPEVARRWQERSLGYRDCRLRVVEGPGAPFTVTARGLDEAGRLVVHDDREGERALHPAHSVVAQEK